jgi:hypothetical protein
MEVIQKIRQREDKVLKKPEIPKLSIENYNQKL